MYLKSIFIFILYSSQIHCQSFKPTELEKYITLFRSLRRNLFTFVGHTSENMENLNRARSMNMLQAPVPMSVPFPCNVTAFRSSKPPTSVHELRPGDIDVVGALGDSLTAGFGLVATNVLQVVMENRGLSWSIGGQGDWRQYMTLPNILKVFNPNLIGFSLGDSFADDRKSQFNPAEGAAISSEIPYMTNILIKRISNDKRVNLKKHWKLITVMFGANDFCLDICYHNPIEKVLDLHRNDLITVLRLLRDYLPRTIVNVVPPPNIRLLMEIKKVPQICQTIHRFECYCFFADKFKGNREKYFDIIHKWQKIDEEIVSMPEFQQNDFTVVFQPFTHGIKIPDLNETSTDFSFMSKDCFHLSQKMNARAANALWNNLLQKVGNKSLECAPLFANFECPTEENPYIFTNSNSNL